LYTFKDEIVLDPFIGSGQAAIAAIESGRHFVGYDIDEEYVRHANERISASAGQELFPLSKSRY
ncbi:hypothetical protein DRQ29_03945, partial [bacterium]